MAQSGCRDPDGLGELECDGAVAHVNGEDTQENGNQGVVRDRTRAQIASEEKEESRTTTRKVRAEVALSRIWRKRRALKREKHLGKIKESAEMGKAPKKTQSTYFKSKSIAKHENPGSVLTNFFQDFYSIPEDQEEATHSERLHWVELWKNLTMDCAGGMLISPKKLERVLKKLKNGKGSSDQITADVLDALPPKCSEKLARSLSRMCWEMIFPEDWLCSLTDMAPKMVGACARCGKSWAT